MPNPSISSYNSSGRQRSSDPLSKHSFPTKTHWAHDQRRRGSHRLSEVPDCTIQPHPIMMAGDPGSHSRQLRINWVNATDQDVIGGFRAWNVAGLPTAEVLRHVRYISSEQRGSLGYLMRALSPNRVSFPPTTTDGTPLQLWKAEEDVPSKGVVRGCEESILRRKVRRTQ